MIQFIVSLGAIAKLLMEIFQFVKEISKEDPKKFMLDLADAIKEVKEKRDPRKLYEVINKL